MAVDFGTIDQDAMDALLRAPVVSNSVATPAQAQAAMAAVGGDANFWVGFLIACADQGTSALGQIQGGPADSTFAAAATAIRRICTLRQFCMFHAKITFDAMVRAQRPPANWLRRGFTFDTRYAAFDFFNGVTHAAAMEPPRGMMRLPSPEEIKAANANAFLAINNSRQRNVVTTNGAVNVQAQTANGFQRPQIGWGG